MFKRLITKIDTKLEFIFDPPRQHCECCGYEFPTYLIYIGSDGGEYCKTCVQVLAYRECDDEE